MAWPPKTAHAYVWPSQGRAGACHHDGTVEPCLRRDRSSTFLRFADKIPEVGLNAEALRSRDQCYAGVTGRGCGLRMMRAP